MARPAASRPTSAFLVCAAPQFDRCCSARSTSIAATTLAETLGRLRPDGVRSANITSGSGSHRGAPGTRRRSPPGQLRRTDPYFPSGSGCSFDGPCTTSSSLPETAGPNDAPSSAASRPYRRKRAGVAATERLLVRASSPSRTQSAPGLDACATRGSTSAQSERRRAPGPVQAKPELSLRRGMRDWSRPNRCRSNTARSWRRTRAWVRSNS